MNKEEENLRTLFQLHHSQYQERYRSADRAVATASSLFVIMTGWVLLSEQDLNGHVKLLISVFVPMIALMAGIRAYMGANLATRIAKVIKKLNIAMRLHEVNVYLPGDTLYPEDWKSFGEKSTWGIIANILQIVVTTIMCLIVIWLKQ